LSTGYGVTAVDSQQSVCVFCTCSIQCRV